MALCATPHAPWVVVEGPVPLDRWKPSGRAGIYVVMHRPDPHGHPAAYTVDYCGESDEILDRRNPWLHHLEQRLLDRTGSTDEIYIAVYPMPDSSRRDRQRLQRLLVNRWRPHFNESIGV